MTESTDTPAATAATTASADKPVRKSGGLSTKLLPELKQIAGGLGIKTQGLKKADLVAAIRQAQSQAQSQQGQGQQGQGQQGQGQQGQGQQGQSQQAQSQQGPSQHGQSQQDGQRTQRRQQDQQEPNPRQGQPEEQQTDQPARDKKQQGQQSQKQQNKQKQSQKQDGQKQDGQKPDGAGNQNRQKQNNQKNNGPQNSSENGSQNGDQAKGGDNRKRDQQAESKNENSEGHNDHSGQQNDDEGGSRRNRRRRGRDRVNTAQGGRGNRNEPDLTVLDDDVVTPCAGILDVLDNYAFVRTSGYLPGTEDVYVSMSMVRKFGLRRGDAIIGQVRQPREGERREKFNPLVQIDSVNGGEPEAAKNRPEYGEMTPVHPAERLRLETTSDDTIGRVIDLVSPLGKGQRGLIVAPAKSGRTTILKSIAASITTNNPETHLMVVLIDERPEEITEFQRSVRGEVVSSTFDRPASDHVTVAELAIERAKRLVELGHDVVVLLDGITRLTRAYNLAAPSGGRVLPGGVDAAALHPAKRFFGAARNLENGGSLTILATVQTGGSSTLDEVIAEEFTGTDNMELRLRREFADQGVFPAVDVVASGTRHQDLLLTPEELAIVDKLRREVGALEGAKGLESLLGLVARTRNNIELLTQVKQG